MADEDRRRNGGSPGRGGSPSGFISRSVIGDIHRAAIHGDDNGGNGSTPSQQQQQQQQQIRVPVEAESSLVVIRDLLKSGLTPSDIQARVLDTPERAVCGVPLRGEGYVIPYFDINGSPLPFYRTRILNADYATNGVKYKQPRKTPNHIYFPRSFQATLRSYSETHPSSRIVIITEGEKKAACACKLGFPAVALSGVDSWRSRTILLPEGTEFYSTEEDGGRGKGSGSGRRGPVKVRLPSSDSSVPELVTLASGFGDLLDAITSLHLSPILIYDSDHGLLGLKAEVQRAATMLGYELVYLGVPANTIKQLVLPATRTPRAEGEGEDEGGKVGLDDFLMDPNRSGPEELQKLIGRAMADPQAFPRHPNPKGFISTQLQNRMSRKAVQQVASMILTELDAGGMRLRDKSTGMPYYYDRTTAHLVPVQLGNTKSAPFHETKFGTLLYQKYGISANDARVITWLASQFTGEEPISDITPRRVLTLITERDDPRPNCQGVAFQASDSQFFAVTGSPNPQDAFRVHTNGDLGILFEQDQVEPLDVDLVLEHFDHQIEEAKHLGYLPSWWSEVLDESSIGLKLEHVLGPSSSTQDIRVDYVLTPQGQVERTYASLLFYISPYLLRHRNMQLPVELTVGPPGSGKSSLYSLRLSVLTGRPLLRNIPSDIKDWQAALAHVGGLHVTDNVHFLNKELKQRLSDEICRIITEPNPHIEQRKLYTNIDELRFPVSCTFGFTSLQLPFNNEDLIQRSVTFHTEYVDREPEGNWVEEQIERRGGREAWVAHHMAFLHLFLRHQWNPEFRTTHRLINLEQSLYIASQVVNPLSTPQSIPHEAGSSEASERTHPITTMSSTPSSPPFSFKLGQTMLANQQRQIQEGDWALQGIRAFIDSLPTPPPEFTPSDIADWCVTREDFSENEILISSRRLARYMSERSSTLASILQIYHIGEKGIYPNYRHIPKLP